MRRAQLFPVILRVLDEADAIAARQRDAQPPLSREELLRATHQADTGHASEVLGQAVLLFTADGSPAEGDVAKVSCRVCLAKMAKASAAVATQSSA